MGFLEGEAFEMPERESAALKVLLPITRTGLLPFDAKRPQEAPPIRRVRLSGGRVLHVRGTGHYTLYRHADDTAEATLSPYVGRWILASPEFRAEIERAGG